jgi:hypothetical protein
MPLLLKQKAPTFFLAACLTLAVHLVALAPSGQESKKCPVSVETADAKFKPGQVWKAKGREGEPDLTATVLRVESLEKIGVFLHIRIDHAAMHPCPGNPVMDTLQHTPIAKAAFEKSITELLRSDAPIPDYREGYEDWRSHCGGVYSLSIAEILSVDEKTARANFGCEGGR